VGETIKQTEGKSPDRDEKGKWLPGKEPGPGRPKGSLNHTTHLKHAILAAVTDAAEKYGSKDTTDYLGTICKNDPMAFVRIAATLLPKEFKGDMNLSLAQAMLDLEKKADP